MKFSFPRIASVAVMMVGSVVLLGWSFDITTLKHVLPDLPAMQPNTALAFILASLSLWLIIGPEGGSPRRHTSGRACAGMVVAIGTLTLGGYAVGVDTGSD